MAGESDDDQVAGGVNPTWEGKMDFVPGMPVDLAQLPELYYQVLAGRVYTLLRFPDTSASRGEIDLAAFAAILDVDAVTKEGWYSASGKYIGAQLPNALV